MMLPEEAVFCQGLARACRRYLQGVRQLAERPGHQLGWLWQHPERDRRQRRPGRKLQHPGRQRRLPLRRMKHQWIVPVKPGATAENGPMPRGRREADHGIRHCRNGFQPVRNGRGGVENCRARPARRAAAAYQIEHGESSNVTADHYFGYARTVNRFVVTNQNRSG